MWGAQRQEKGWNTDFVYAKSLRIDGDTVFGVDDANSAPKEDWLDRSYRQLGSRSYGGISLAAKDAMVRDRKLAEAGRELNRGRITRDEYSDFVATLLGSKENVRARGPPAPPLHKTRPKSAPSHAPQAWAGSDSSVPVFRDADLDQPHARRIADRSVNDRRKAVAWMQKVANRTETPLEFGRPLSGAADDLGGRGVRASKRVRVNRCPKGTAPAAVGYALSVYGVVSHVEALGEGAFVVRYESADQAKMALFAGNANLRNAVVVSPVAPDATVADLRRTLGRCGPIASAKHLRGRGAAIVTFEAAQDAAAAVGFHRVDESCDVVIRAVPRGATADHLARAYGGAKFGVRAVRLGADGSATVVFESPEWARRGAGPRTVAITTEGGGTSAMGRAQAGARKGAAAPWQTDMPSRPFADGTLHSHNFGNAPRPALEYQRRAAGTFDAAAAHDDGRRRDAHDSKYNTRKHTVVGEKVAVTLECVAHEIKLEITEF
ncbi:hypothetical protein M885DRAFT_458190 [Pelagophyceae sp. CCMP2097]|nr:hypothetical protein M885DRAFT_458190 [Pelagophyceae sp. CCMP2097]|mmetsp:Transcript_14642/g.49108  ORF Transcript_14642/g.49108 Transcript_14642/m.49108 type:complete len:492 (+) Transcript_14642:38-1513(+)